MKKEILLKKYDNETCEVIYNHNDDGYLAHYIEKQIIRKCILHDDYIKNNFLTGKGTRKPKGILKKINKEDSKC